MASVARLKLFKPTVLASGRRSLATSTIVLGGDRIVPATNFTCWNSKEPVKLRMEDTAPGNYEPILVQTMIREAVKKYGSSPAVTSYDGKIKWNYDEYLNQIETAAKGFNELGLEPYHAVGIMGNNCPQWFTSSIGSIFAGGLSCGIYLTSSPGTVGHIVGHAPVDILVMEDIALLERMLHKNDPLKSVKAFVMLNGDVDKSIAPNVFKWSDVVEIGQQVPDSRLKEREELQAVNKACMFIYTSGTTGPPKGALLSHDNVTYSSKIAMEHYAWNQERWLSYLPLSHVAACLIDCYMTLHTGCDVHFADKNALKGTLVENMKRVKPTKFFAVPRAWEKMAEKMQEVGRKNTGLKKKIADFAKAAATKHHTLVREGKRDPAKPSWDYKLAKKLVFNRIHDALGLDVAVKGSVPTSSAAAPLSMETFYYFQSLDIVLTEFYGCTEASGPQTANMSGPLCQPGSVGQAYWGVNNKIIDPDPVTGLGEVATRSRNIFMGYHGDKEKTLSTFKDDWYRSGDVGRIDEDGFLWLSGRLKEVLITSGGKNIYPVPVEENVKKAMQSFISQVVVIGDQRKYLVCLITLLTKVDKNGQPLDELEDSVLSWCNKVLGPGAQVKTVSDFTNNEKLMRKVQECLEVANSHAVDNPHKVQKFAILPRDLSIQGEELGPTLKLKRHTIAQKYHDVIEDMYKN